MKLWRREFLRNAAASAAVGSLASPLHAHARSADDAASQTRLVDAHVHLFDPANISYPWLDGVPAIKRRIDTIDYRSAAAQTRVDRIVVVEAAPVIGSSLAEMRWLNELSRKDSLIGAVVAQAAVENGDRVAEELDALSGAGPLRGIRRIIGPPFQTDPEFALRPQVQAGIRALSRYNLVFDLAGVSTTNLPQVVSLVRACPNVPFILNHLGRAPIQSGALEPWRSHLRDLAKLPNAHCKISNVIRDAGPGWTIDRIRPFVETVIDAFGFERVMFGSDFPVVTLAERGGIATSIDVMNQLLPGAASAEREKFFNANAARLYRL